MPTPEFTFELLHYWRSSASWRVRWALLHKGINCKYIPVNLLDRENYSNEHLKLSPLGAIPVLKVLENGNIAHTLTESTSIIEWLDETYDGNSLLWGNARNRARIRELTQIINSGTHPLQNLSVQKHLSEDAEERKAWAKYWIKRGLAAYEQIVSRSKGKFSVGDQLSMADLCLLPQLYNARRNDIEPKEMFPLLSEIEEASIELDSYQQSHPDRFKPEA